MGWARWVAWVALLEGGCWQWCDDGILGWMHVDAAVATGGHVYVSWQPTSRTPFRGAVLGADGSWTPATGIDVPSGIVRGGDAALASIEAGGMRIDLADPFGDHLVQVDLDPPAEIGTYTDRVDGAWRGDELIVVTQRRVESTSPTSTLWIAAVGADGTVRAQPRVLDADIMVDPIGVATIGGTTWVTWTKLVPPGVYELEAARIGAGASLVDTRALAPTVVRQLVSSGTTGLAIVDGNSTDPDAIVLDENGATMQHPFAGGMAALSPYPGQGYLSADGWFDRDGNRIADPPVLPADYGAIGEIGGLGGFVIRTAADGDRLTLRTAPLPFAGVVGADVVRDSAPIIAYDTHICRYR